VSAFHASEIVTSPLLLFNSRGERQLTSYFVLWPVHIPLVTTQVSGDLVVPMFIQNVSKHTSTFIFLKLQLLKPS